MSAVGRYEGAASASLVDEFEFLRAAEAVSSNIGSKKVTLPDLISCSDGTYRFGSEKTIFLHEFLTVDYPAWIKGVEAYSKFKFKKGGLENLLSVVEYLRSEVAFFQASQQEQKKTSPPVQERQPLLDVATGCYEKLETLSSQIQRVIGREKNQTEQAINTATVCGYQLVPITEARATIIRRQWSLSLQGSEDLFCNMERFPRDFAFLSSVDRKTVIDSLEKLSTDIFVAGRGQRDDLAAKVGTIWKSLQKEVFKEEPPLLPVAEGISQQEKDVFVQALQNKTSLPVVSSLSTGLESKEEKISLEAFFHTHVNLVYYFMKSEIRFLEKELPRKEEEFQVWKSRLKKIEMLASDVGIAFWMIKDRGGVEALTRKKPLGYQGIPIFFRKEIYQELDSTSQPLYLFSAIAAIAQIQSNFTKLTGMIVSQSELSSNSVASSSSLCELWKVEPILSFFLTKVRVPSVHFPADASKTAVESMTLLDWLAHQQFFLNQLKIRLKTDSDTNLEVIEAPLDALVIHVGDGLKVFETTLKGKAPENYQGALDALSFRSHELSNTWAKVSLLYQLLQTEVGVKESRSEASSDFELVDNPNHSIRELIEQKRRKG